MTEPNEAVVRTATLTDAGPICRIYNAALAERGSTLETEPRSASDFGSRMDGRTVPAPGGRCGERGHRLGWARPLHARPCYAGIGECSVYVALKARGRGVGTALTEALAAAAHGNGFHKLIGKLFTDNTASIPLVERCGFSSVGLHCRHGQLDGEW